MMNKNKQDPQYWILIIYNMNLMMDKYFGICMCWYVYWMVKIVIKLLSIICNLFLRK